MDFLEEAEHCRQKALAYIGQPEGEFLLKVASAFEDLSQRIISERRDGAAESVSRHTSAR